jgi:hypothetical protein
MIVKIIATLFGLMMITSLMGALTVGHPQAQTALCACLGVEVFASAVLVLVAIWEG